MTAEREAYLAKAKDAELMAARFDLGSFEYESWLKIAQGYRELAESPERSLMDLGPKP